MHSVEDSHEILFKTRVIAKKKPRHWRDTKDNVTPAPPSGYPSQGIIIADGHPGHSDNNIGIRLPAWRGEDKSSVGVTGWPSWKSNFVLCKCSSRMEHGGVANALSIVFTEEQGKVGSDDARGVGVPLDTKNVGEHSGNDGTEDQGVREIREHRDARTGEEFVGEHNPSTRNTVHHTQARPGAKVTRESFASRWQKGPADPLLHFAGVAQNRCQCSPGWCPQSWVAKRSPPFRERGQSPRKHGVRCRA